MAPSRTIDMKISGYYHSNFSTSGNLESYINFNEVQISADSIYHHCEGLIRKAIKTLAPPSKSNEVVDIAISIALKYASKKITQSTMALLKSEVKKNYDDPINTTNTKINKPKTKNNKNEKIPIQSSSGMPAFSYVNETLPTMGSFEEIPQNLTL